MKQRLQQIVTNPFFRYIFLGLTILFVISTVFINVNPKGFIKYGYLGIFVFNIVSSGLLIIPTLSPKFHLLPLVLVSGLGNGVNTSINYLVGSSGKSYLVKVSFLQKIKTWLKRFQIIVIYLLAILPLPLDVNGLLSGYTGVSYKKFCWLIF